MLATRFLLEYGMGENLAAVPVDENGTPRLQGGKAVQFQNELDRLMGDAERAAEQALVQKWHLVRSVVGELYNQGVITGERFDELSRTFRSSPQGLPYVNSEFSSRASRQAEARCEKLLSRADQ